MGGHAMSGVKLTHGRSLQVAWCEVQPCTVFLTVVDVMHVVLYQTDRVVLNVLSHVVGWRHVFNTSQYYTKFSSGGELIVIFYYYIDYYNICALFELT